MMDDRETLRAWLDLLRASNVLKKSVDAKFRNVHGLSISRFDVLSALDRAGPEGLRAGALTEHLKVTEGNTTQVTAPLVKAGLVSRTPSAADGRVAIFKITSEGASLFARMADDHRRWINEGFAGLSDPQTRSLRRLLAKLITSLERADQRKDAA